jgi:hypothetical protein
MPRNPHKTRCQVPGCRNWAMRDHTHCRSHRDAELGPRGAGAPCHNLNALRTGHDAHPLTRDDLDQLVHTILRAPDQLPRHLYLTTQSIHRRCQDPVKTLLALQALIPSLLSRVADAIFVAELHDLLEELPPSRRSQIELFTWRQALQGGPIRKLEFLRALRDRIQASAGASTLGTPPPAPGSA